MDEAALFDVDPAALEAILEPMVEAGEPVGERHTIRGSPSAIAALLAHFDEQGFASKVSGTGDGTTNGSSIFSRSRT